MRILWRLYMRPDLKVTFLAVFMLGFFSTHTAHGDTLAPPQPGVTPVLICTKPSVELVIGICGVIGCNASVTHGSDMEVYNLRRKRYSSGALDYVPGPRAKEPCTFRISALTRGVRRVTNAPSCSPDLRNAPCRWLYP